MLTIDRPTVLTFWTWAQYGSEDQDHFVVRVYDCFNGTWEDKWDAINQPTGQINSYSEQLSFTLDEYIGKNIKIGFRGYNGWGSYLGWDWFIDDVKVVPTDTLGPNVGVTESLLDSQVSLYPNPVKDRLHIDSKTMIHQLEIVAADGALIENKKVGGYAVDCRLEGYAKGVYFIRLVTDEGVITKKVILYD